VDTVHLNSVNEVDGNYPPNRGSTVTLHKSDYINGKRRKHGRSYRLIGLVILIILIGGLVFGYSHYHKKSTVKTSGVVKTLPLTSQIGLPVANQQYYSTNLSLGFNYPKSWTITDKINTNILTIQSPAVELLTSTNKLAKGKITLTIQNQSPVIPGFQKGNATTALESQIITYSNPTSDQRASTYISFLHYASSTTPSSNIDAIYITGNAGYQLNQYIPQSDILAVSPVVGITFTLCANSTCTSSGAPTSITSTAWDTTSFSGTLLAILKSLSIS